MQTERRIYSLPVRSLLIFLLLLGVFLSVLIVYFPLMVATLLFGVLAIFLVIPERTRYIGLLTIFVLAPFMPIIKAFTGVRYAPLMLDTSLLLLVAFSFMRGVLQHRLKFSAMDILILLFFAVALIQIFNPHLPNLGIGIEGFRYTAYPLLGFFAARLMVKSTRQIRQVMSALYWSAAIVAIYGIKQYFLPSSVDLNIVHRLPEATGVYYFAGTPHHMRAFSTMSGPFHLGIYMVLTVLLLVVLSLQPGRKRFPLILAIIITMGCLLLTGARSTWVGLIGGLAFYLFLQIREKKFFLALRTVIGVSLLFLVIFLITYNFGFFLSVYEYLLSITKMTRDRHLLERVASWRNKYLPLIIRNPFGYGTGAAVDTVGVFVTHSSYIKVAVELGLIGSILFFAILLSSFMGGLKTYLQLKNSFLKLATTWILSFLVAISITGLAVPIFDCYPANLYFWFLLGILVQLGDIDTNRAADSHKKSFGSL